MLAPSCHALARLPLYRSALGQAVIVTEHPVRRSRPDGTVDMLEPAGTACCTPDKIKQIKTKILDFTTQNGFGKMRKTDSGVQFDKVMGSIPEESDDGRGQSGRGAQ